MAEYGLAAIPPLDPARSFSGRETGLDTPCVDKFEPMGGDMEEMEALPRRSGLASGPQGLRSPHAGPLSSAAGRHSFERSSDASSDVRPEFRNDSLPSRPGNAGPRRGSFQHSRPAKSVATSDCLDDDAEQLSLRERVNLLFSDPSSSVLARFVSGFFLLLIVMSTMTFLLETVPDLSADPDFGDPDRECMWFTIETIFIVFFTFEYVIRWATEPLGSIVGFPFEPFNIVDLIAILPYYLEITLSAPNTPCNQSGGSQEGPFGSFDLRFIRVVRLARVFRVLKLGRGLNATEVLLNTFRASQQALMVPFFFLLLGMVVFSSLLYLVEQGTYNQEDGRYYITNSQGHEVEAMFPSIPDTLWWSIVTMTTVGYGDLYPHTAIGKAINSMAMMFGTLFFAMPIAIVGAEFTNAWDAKKMRDKEDSSRKTPYSKERRREVKANTKDWGGNELNHFNVRFNDSNISMEEFFGFCDRRKDCCLDYKQGFLSLGAPSMGYRRLKAGLLFELELMEYTCQTGTVVRDEGLTLVRVQSGNPLVDHLRAGQFVGRRLLQVRTKSGTVVDTRSKSVLQEFQAKYPKGDTRGDWASSWLGTLGESNDKVTFVFESEQEVGDRMLRLVEPDELIPDHFNADTFGRGKKLPNPRRFRKDLMVPVVLCVVSDRESSLCGAYVLQRAKADRQAVWKRGNEEGSPLVRSCNGKWEIRSGPGADAGMMRSRDHHGGSLPGRIPAGGWEHCTDSPRARWQQDLGTVVKEAPQFITVDSDERPDASGRYQVCFDLWEGQPRWLRCGPLADSLTAVVDTVSEDGDGHAPEAAALAPCALQWQQGRWVVVLLDSREVVLRECTSSSLPAPLDGTTGTQCTWEYFLGDWDACAETYVSCDDGQKGKPSASLLHLAYKVFHARRTQQSQYRYADATSPYTEKNINMYTKDFIAQLYHHVGLAKLPTGFRSRAGLRVYYGKEMVRSSKKFQMDDTKEVTFASDSDMGVFGLAEGKVVPVYVMANQALLEDDDERKGRIAGELLSLAQNLWLNCNKPSDFSSPVYLATYRGMHMRFYTATFNSEYLEYVSRGTMPPTECQVTVHSYPNRRDGPRGGASGFHICDHLRRGATDVFPETGRATVDNLSITNLSLAMDPRMEIQDGTLRYVTMPEADDNGGTGPLRVTRIERGPFGPAGVKVGMRLLRVKVEGSRTLVSLNTREDYDSFIWETCRGQSHVINVIVTVAEDSDYVDFLKPRERAVAVEMLTRLRLRILKYLVQDLNEQFSFAPASGVSRRHLSRIDAGGRLPRSASQMTGEVPRRQLSSVSNRPRPLSASLKDCLPPVLSKEGQLQLQSPSDSPSRRRARAETKVDHRIRTPSWQPLALTKAPTPHKSVTSRHSDPVSVPRRSLSWHGRAPPPAFGRGKGGEQAATASTRAAGAQLPPSADTSMASVVATLHAADVQVHPADGDVDSSRQQTGESIGSS
eukprot:TRINITY_DN1278_c0_g1_i5.p1 TRINITY_DN1278_c0_g1~~TRINITY_DN1278_c0_g1_i5.p1  ORF type:complete len:1459 (+),score=303.41 TRINITY_DN1278_c0_g1_i5:49-4425(+)